jgi:hypothetical protein
MQKRSTALTCGRDVCPWSIRPTGYGTYVSVFHQSSLRLTSNRRTSRISPHSDASLFWSLKTSGDHLEVSTLSWIEGSTYIAVNIGAIDGWSDQYRPLVLASCVGLKTWILYWAAVQMKGETHHRIAPLFRNPCSTRNSLMEVAR